MCENKPKSHDSYDLILSNARLVTMGEGHNGYQVTPTQHIAIAQGKIAHISTTPISGSKHLRL